MPAIPASREGSADDEVPVWARVLDVAAANAHLDAGGYGLHVASSPEGPRLCGPGTGTGIPIDSRLRLVDLCHALVRLGRTRQQDAEWTSQVNRLLEPDRAPITESGTRRQSRGAQQAARLAADPLLRMHCALTPASLADTTSGTTTKSGNGTPERTGTPGEPNDNAPPAGSASAATPAEAVTSSSTAPAGTGPRPGHPRHPAGTLAVTTRALATESAGRTLLDHVLDARVPRRESAVDHFAEYFVRPLVRSFRFALEHHRTGLLSTHGAAVAFELSPELAATGRVVLTGPFRDTTEIDEATVHAGAARIADTVSALRRLGERHVTGPDEVRAAVERVLANELRNLEPATAALLDSAHPLRRFVHAVPRNQDSTLKQVLRTVQERTRQRRYDDRVGYPTVTVDLEQALRVPGTGRFCWDVRDAGGQLVVLAGPSDPDTERAGELLAERGVQRSAIRTLSEHEPPGRSRARALDELTAGGADVVAAFTAPRRHEEVRAAVTARRPGVLVSGVLGSETPGAADSGGGRCAAESVGEAVATFETAPRRRPGLPLLSHAHSLEELQLSDMRPNRTADDWGVRLTAAQSMSIVDSVRSDVDISARRTAHNALAHHRHSSGNERVIAAIHHVLTRKQFRKGPRANYRLEHAYRDMIGFVHRGEPIEALLPSFPIKQSLNRLKAFGPLPDFAELGALARLRELQEAVRGVYPPGLHLNILTDGRHFRSRPAAATAAYARRLREYVDLLGIGGTTVRDIDELARQQLGPRLPEQRRHHIDANRTRITATVGDLDITRDPLGVIAEVDVRAEYAASDPLARSLRMLGGILMSLVYSVPVRQHPGQERTGWSKQVFTDPYRVDGPIDPMLGRARRELLRWAWNDVIDYLAVMRADEELGYERLLGERLRLTINPSRPGRCGFTYLGGSGLLPWQGTGAVDHRGRVASDFAVSLIDQGFVPVYSPLLGRRQPWLMVPATATEPAPGGRGELRLAPDFADSIRLRRK